MVPRRSSSEPTPSDAGRGRSILLLVSGSIAVYKSCFLLRRLIERQRVIAS